MKLHSFDPDFFGQIDRVACVDGWRGFWRRGTFRKHRGLRPDRRWDDGLQVRQRITGFL